MHHHCFAKASALILILALLPMTSCTVARTERFALILSSDEGHYWENIIEGAQNAAQHMGVELVCYAPDEENRVFLQDLPLKALEEDADAFIVASNGEKELIEVLQKIHHMPVVAIGNRLSTVETVTTVLNDNEQMGLNMASALSVLDDSEPRSALLLTDTAEYNANDLRELNLRKEMFAIGIRVSERIFTGENREWAYRQTMQHLYLHPELDAVVAFSAQSTVGAAQAVEYLGRDVVVVGTDIVPDMISYIESERVVGSVMRNSFGMGYLGVEYAVDYMRDEPVPANRTLVSVVVNGENLFTPEIESVVFPYE